MLQVTTYLDWHTRDGLVIAQGIEVTLGVRVWSAAEDEWTIDHIYKDGPDRKLREIEPGSLDHNLLLRLAIDQADDAIRAELEAEAERAADYRAEMRREESEVL